METARLQQGKSGRHFSRYFLACTVEVGPVCLSTRPGGLQMRRGFVPLDVHAAIEPIAAIILIAAPWIFGFSDVNSAKIISIAIGLIVLLSGAMTRWRLSVVRLIPLRLHFMTDLLLGLVLIVAPFIAGFSANGAA